MLQQLTGNGTRDNDTISNKILQYDKQRINGELTPLKGLAKRRQAEASMFAGKEVKPTEAKPAAGPLQFAAATKEKQAQPKQEAKAAGPLAGTGSQLALSLIHI